MIKVGDKAKVLNENAEGIVVEILKNHYVLLQIGDFEYSYPVSQLVFHEDPVKPVESLPIKPFLRDEESVSENISRGERKVKLRKGKKAPLIREIDLHSQNILVDCRGMSGSEILEYQLNYFLRELEKSMDKRERNVIFIHGRGEGVLKTEIRRILSSYTNIEYYDAPLRNYGGGATMVEIY